MSSVIVSTIVTEEPLDEDVFESSTDEITRQAKQFVKLIGLENDSRRRIYRKVFKTAASRDDNISKHHPGQKVKQYINAARESSIRLNNTILDQSIRVGLNYSDVDHLVTRGRISNPEDGDFIVVREARSFSAIDEDSKDNYFTFITSSVKSADYMQTMNEPQDRNVIQSDSSITFTSKEAICNFIVEESFNQEFLKNVLNSLKGQPAYLSDPEVVREFNSYVEYRARFTFKDGFTPLTQTITSVRDGRRVVIGLFIPQITIGYDFHEEQVALTIADKVNNDLSIYQPDIPAEDVSNFSYCGSAPRSMHVLHHNRSIDFGNAVSEYPGAKPPRFDDRLAQISSFSISTLNRSHGRGRYKANYSNFSIIGEFSLLKYQSYTLAIAMSLITGIDFKLSAGSTAHPLYPNKDLYLKYGSETILVQGKHWLSHTYNTTDLWTGLDVSISPKENSAVRYQSSRYDTEISGQYTLYNYNELMSFLQHELRFQTRDSLVIFLQTLFKIDDTVKITYQNSRLSRGSIISDHRNRLIFLLDDISTPLPMIETRARYKNEYIKEADMMGTLISVLPLSVHLVHLFWHVCRTDDYIPVGINGTASYLGVQISKSDARYRYVIPKYVLRKLPAHSRPIQIVDDNKPRSGVQSSLLDNLRTGPKQYIVNERWYTLELFAHESVTEIDVGKYYINLSEVSGRGSVLCAAFHCPNPRPISEVIRNLDVRVPVYSTFKGLSSLLLDQVSGPRGQGKPLPLLYALIGASKQTMSVFSQFNPSFLGCVDPQVCSTGTVQSNSGFHLDLMISQVIVNIMSKLKTSARRVTGAYFVFDDTLVVILPKLGGSKTCCVTTTPWRHSSLLNYTKISEATLDNGSKLNISLMAIYNSMTPHTSAFLAINDPTSDY